jgi:GR25 family glycosyltransferase involved in LPS biosynthesis
MRCALHVALVKQRLTICRQGHLRIERPHLLLLSPDPHAAENSILLQETHRNIHFIPYSVKKMRVTGVSAAVGILALMGIIIFLFSRSRPQRLSQKLSSIQASLNVLRDEILSCWPSGFRASHFLDIPMVYINLRESIGRRLWIEEQFQQIGAQCPLRVEAVLGTKYLLDPHSEPWIDPEVNSILQDAAVQRRVSASEIGCLLSHLKAIGFIHSMPTSSSPVMVLEDDADFSSVGLWSDSLTSLARRLPHDWNFVQVSAACPDFPSVDPNNKSLIIQRTRNHCFSAAAYMISKKAIDTFHKFFFQEGRLTSTFFHLALKKGLSFLADESLFFILDPPRLFMESVPRIVQYNALPFMESTIHPDHTIPMHLENSMKVLNFYKSLRERNEVSTE